MRRSAITATLAACGAVVLAAPAASSRHVPTRNACRPAHSVTIAETRLARIFKRSRSAHSRTVACLFHDQRVLRLDEPPDSVYARAPFALKYHYAAFVDHTAYEETSSGQSQLGISVVDLSRRPTKERPHRAVVIGGVGFEDRSLFDIKQIALTRRATIGWSQVATGPHGAQIFASAHGARRLLSEAAGLDLESLRVCGHGRSFCWREGGVSKSAVVD